VHRGGNNLDHVGRAPEAVRVAHVAGDDFDVPAGEVIRSRRFAGEDADLQAAIAQTIDDDGAEPAGSTGEEDHEAPSGATWRRTASSTEPAPGCTGSR